MSQYAVIGSPIQHSLSPRLFKLFAEQTGQSLSYQALEVKPEDLGSALAHLRQQGYQGLNVTAPLKEKAFLEVDDCSQSAKSAKAVNALSFKEDGSCYGDNFDGLGFIRDLTQRKKYSIANKSLLVLGAGGAVRGLMAALLEENPQQVLISNRGEEKAKLLAESFENHKTPVLSVSWDEISAATYDLVIQGTAAGTQGERLSLPLGILKPGACCYDLTYGQGAAFFLAWAKEAGAEFCYDGLGMLVEQAAQAFYQWCGQKVDTETILSTLTYV